jgi:hypothetical protein
MWSVSAITASELVMTRPLEFADIVGQSVALAPIQVAGRDFNRRRADRSVATANVSICTQKCTQFHFGRSCRSELTPKTRLKLLISL